jgi:flagellar biogenesis protein FliO
MVARLQAWFARQSLTVKLLIAVPVLAGAVLWATFPDTSPRAADLGNRPVLPPLSTPGGASVPGGASATGALVTPGAASAGVPSNPALAPGVGAAQATVAVHQEPGEVDSSLSWTTLLRTLVSIVVVIGLILLSARGLKYFMATQGHTPGIGANVRVVETTYVPAPSGRGRSALHLIEVGDRLLLVGATDSNLSLLAEFEEGLGGRIRLAPREAAVPGVPGTPAGAAGVTSVPTAPAVAASSAAAGLSFGELLAAASDKAPDLSAPSVPSTPGATPGAPSAEPASARDADLAHMLERLRASKQRLESDL